MKTMSASKKQFVEMHNVKAFVVPNPASRMTLGNVQDLPAYCVDKKKNNDIYVEVWITSDEYDNVACHGGPISWSFFPESLFKGKKEGDVIKIGKYDVTLQQTGFRYQSFGRFENVLEKVLRDLLLYELKLQALEVRSSTPADGLRGFFKKRSVSHGADKRSKEGS